MIPVLGQVQKELGPHGVQVVAIDIHGANLEAWEKYWRDLGGGEVIWVEDDILTPYGSVAAKYELIQLGTHVLVDREGRIADRGVYQASSKGIFDELKQEISKLLSPAVG
jgi:thiol-disulfide isomerase/thioredoxin